MWPFLILFAALAAALVSLIYLATILGLDWRGGMIWSEIILVAGLSVGAFGGPSGGLLRPIAGGDTERRRDYAPAVSLSRLRSFLLRDS